MEHTDLTLTKLSLLRDYDIVHTK